PIVVGVRFSGLLETRVRRLGILLEHLAQPGVLAHVKRAVAGVAHWGIVVEVERVHLPGRTDERVRVLVLVGPMVCRASALDTLVSGRRPASAAQPLMLELVFVVA